jgi:exodeoxyribonuclease VII large subunit
VLTGIGHERDSTVLDEVANQRFDTPSKVIAAIENTVGQRVRETREHFERIVHHATQQLQQARRAVDQPLSQTRLAVQKQLAQSRQSCVHLHRDIGHLAKTQVALAKQEIAAKMAHIRSEAQQGLRQSRVAVANAWDLVASLCTGAYSVDRDR